MKENKKELKKIKNDIVNISNEFINQLDNLWIGVEYDNKWNKKPNIIWLIIVWMWMSIIRKRVLDKKIKNERKINK